jgi:HK97 family phage major capsid protein
MEKISIDEAKTLFDASGLEALKDKMVCDPEGNEVEFVPMSKSLDVEVVKENKTKTNKENKMKMNLKSFLKELKDKRYIENVYTKAIYGEEFNSEDAANDGGSMVVDDLAPVQQVVFTRGLTQAITLIPTSQAALKVPVCSIDQTLAAILTGQGYAKAENKLELVPVTLTLTTYAGIINVSDELMEDAPAISAIVRDQIGSALNLQIDSAIATAIKAAANEVSITRKTALEVNKVDLTAMLASIVPGEDYTWIVSNSAFPTFVEALDNSSYLGIPTAGNASYKTVYNFPVIISPFMSTVGTQYDIVLLKKSAVVGAVKGTGDNGFDVNPWSRWEYDINQIRGKIRFAADTVEHKATVGSQELGDIITLASKTS